MSRGGKFVTGAAVVCFVADEAITAHRTGGLMLLGLAVTLVFLAATILGFGLAFAEWRELRWRAVLPVATCIFLISIHNPLGRLISRAVFSWSLPSYEAVVRRVESGSIPAHAEISDITPQAREARLACTVFARKDTNGMVSVMFMTQSGFPALHSGYMYCSSGQPCQGIESS